MGLGTVVFDNEIYNLEYMSSEEVKKIYNLVQHGGNKIDNVEKKIQLSGKLYTVYVYKTSIECINTKVNNQLNSMRFSITQINSKFNEKSKNYEKINDEMLKSLNEFEDVLKQFANKFDAEINELIIEKASLQYKLQNAILKRRELKNIELQKKGSIINKIKCKVTKKNKNEVSDEYTQCEKNILNIPKEIKQVNSKIENLNDEKKAKIYDAMEIGNKSISVGIKKRRKIKSIANFFNYKFNTYKVIIKNIIEPLNQRIDEFKVNELRNVNGKAKEFNLEEFEQQIVQVQI